MTNFQICDCINPDATTILSSSSIGEAESVLLKYPAAEIYILNELDELVGLVPDYDLLKFSWLGLNRDQPIASIMSPISIALTSSDSFETLVQILSHHIHPRIPVVEGQRLLGTIDRATVMLALCRLRSGSDVLISESKPTSHKVIPSPKFVQTGKNRNFREPGFYNNP